MNPVEFKEQNIVFAKDQPEYMPLPAHCTPAGRVISCWSLTWRERLKLLVTGRVWVDQLTFNHPLQPIGLNADRPFLPAPRSRFLSVIVRRFSFWSNN